MCIHESLVPLILTKRVSWIDCCVKSTKQSIMCGTRLSILLLTRRELYASPGWLSTTNINQTCIVSLLLCQASNKELCVLERGWAFQLWRVEAYIHLCGDAAPPILIKHVPWIYYCVKSERQSSVLVRAQLSISIMTRRGFNVPSWWFNTTSINETCFPNLLLCQASRNIIVYWSAVEYLNCDETNVVCIFVTAQRHKFNQTCIVSLLLCQASRVEFGVLERGWVFNCDETKVLWIFITTQYHQY